MQLLSIFIIPWAAGANGSCKNFFPQSQNSRTNDRPSRVELWFLLRITQAVEGRASLKVLLTHTLPTHPLVDIHAHLSFARQAPSPLHLQPPASSLVRILVWWHLLVLSIARTWHEPNLCRGVQEGAREWEAFPTGWCRELWDSGQTGWKCALLVV